MGPDAMTQLLFASPAKAKVHCDVQRIGNRDLWRGGGTELQATLREFLQRR